MCFYIIVIVQNARVVLSCILAHTVTVIIMMILSITFRFLLSLICMSLSLSLYLFPPSRFSDLACSRTASDWFTDTFGPIRAAEAVARSLVVVVIMSRSRDGVLKRRKLRWE